MAKQTRRGRHSRLSKHQPLIQYLDASDLGKTLVLPQTASKATIAFAIVAGIIGLIIFVSYVNYAVAGPMREQTELQQNLNREVSLDLPYLSALMPLDDAAIMQTLTDAGYTLYEQQPIGADPAGGFEVIKLPEDVSLDDAAVLYLEGINNLNAANAVKLLKGSWMLTINRVKNTDMRVRYADFSAGNPEAAIQSAMAAEGIDAATIIETGEDDVGNSYSTGLITTDTGTYTWRVSAIPLNEVYSIRGLPTTAQYVGVRFTK